MDVEDILMVLADKSYQLLACHYIDSQLKKLSQEIIGAREASDVECVHQSRVASRRLRAAFGVFEICFPAKVIKKWRDEIKELTKAFGPARDADVHIEFLNKTLSGLGSDEKTFQPGIKRLLLRTKQHREKLQDKIIKTINRLESRAILADIHSVVERIIFCMSGEEPDLKNEYVFSQTSGHIRNRLIDMISCQNCLENKDDKTGHHQMRIAAKRLRYTMEICREPYGERLDNAIKVVKNIQTILGDIHDCDVWVDYIDHFMQEELRRTKEYFGNEKPYYLLYKGFGYLQQERQQTRQCLFEIFVRYWKRLNRHKFWETLELNLQSSQAEYEKPGFKIVEIRKGNSSERAIEKNIVNRGYSRKSSGIEGSSQ
ncbi:MAG: CHAD domain-containing protein [Sedimentisphaerales bacterium]|nr:CHAD domain-containing protein [Sedimentisphaerales bacterium]